MTIYNEIPDFLQKYQEDFFQWAKANQSGGEEYALGKNMAGETIICHRNDDFVHIIEYPFEQDKRIAIFPNYGVLLFKDNMLVACYKNSFDFLFENNEEFSESFMHHISLFKQKVSAYLQKLQKTNVDADTYKKAERNFSNFNKEMEDALLRGIPNGKFSSMLVCCVLPVMCEQEETISFLGNTGRIPDYLLKEYNTLNYIYNALYEKMYDGLSKGLAPDEIKKQLLHEAQILHSYKKKGKLSFDFFTNILFAQQRNILIIEMKKGKTQNNDSCEQAEGNYAEERKIKTQNSCPRMF